MARRFRFSGVPGGGEADPWFRIGTLDVTTTMFVTLLSATMFVVYAIAPGFFSLFMLYPSQVWSGFEIWRIGTWPLSNDISLWSVTAIAPMPRSLAVSTSTSTGVAQSPE